MHLDLLLENEKKVHDTESRYKPSKQIRFKTVMLQSDLFDYNDAYIVVIHILCGFK